MKRIIFSILLGFFILGLPVMARAQTLVSSDPGCSPDFLILLWNQADAVRARNRAYEMELISLNKSVLQLTCFDQAMRLSTRLGFIFSDDIPAAPPVQNVVVIGGLLAYSGWGALQLLAKNMNNVMNDAPPNPPYGLYDGWIDNFPPPFPRPLPLNALSVLVAPGSAIQTAISGITAFQQVDRLEVAKVTVLTQEINKLISNIPKIAASSLGAYMVVVKDKIAERQNLINSIEADRGNKMPSFLGDIRTAIMGASTDMICNNISTGDPQYLPGDLWTTGNPVSNFAPAYPVTCGVPVCESVCVSNTTICCQWGPTPPCPQIPAADYVAGSPYYTLEDLFYRTTPLAGEVFKSLINPPNMNSLILDMAQADLLLLETQGVLLDTATQLAIWPKIPLSVFSSKPTVQQLVKDMNPP